MNQANEEDLEMRDNKLSEGVSTYGTKIKKIKKKKRKKKYNTNA